MHYLEKYPVGSLELEMPPMSTRHPTVGVSNGKIASRAQTASSHCMVLLCPRCLVIGLAEHTNPSNEPT